jgi:hypothetical protein
MNRTYVMSCEFCERELPMGSTVCHHCGRPQIGQSPQRFWWFMLAIVAMFAVAVAEHYLFFAH